MKNRTARIAAIEAELHARGLTLSMGDDLDDDLRAAVLHDLLIMEDSWETTIRKRLGGNAPNDLWTLIERLAGMNIVLENTDHLDDATLLKQLDEYLDETVVIPHDPETIMHVDFIGTGSEEDIAAWLRYYASEQDREDWLREFPKYELPPRERPPYDRDRVLPKAEELRRRAS